MGDAAHAQLGAVLSGKYRIDGVLGEGGMGVVFAATHLQLDQPVAIKLVRPETLGRPEIISRLLREAKASAKLRSEHVVRVLDVGTLEDGSPFIVMELLQGMDLSTLIDTHGPLPVPVAVDYVLQACDAIAEAHANGIVHRDLKPANLFLTVSSHGKRVIKVLDFGIAKTTQPGELTMTGATTMMGSPAYMSPEQLRSAHKVDGRTDIWSLGIILWQLVTGHVPFNADTFTELCIRIAVDPLPPVPRTPGLGSALEAVLRRTLEKDPVERFSTVAELAAALAPFTTPEARVIAERLRDYVARGDSVDATFDSSLGQPAPRPQGRALRAGLIVSGIAAVSVVVLALAVPGANHKGGPIPGIGAPTVTPLPVTPGKVETPPPETPPVKVETPPVKVEQPPVKVEPPPAKIETPPPEPPPVKVEVLPIAAPDAGVVSVTPPPPTPGKKPPPIKKPKHPPGERPYNPFESPD